MLQGWYRLLYTLVLENSSKVVCAGANRSVFAAKLKDLKKDGDAYDDCSMAEMMQRKLEDSWWSGLHVACRRNEVFSVRSRDYNKKRGINRVTRKTRECSHCLSLFKLRRTKANTLHRLQ